MPGVKEGLIDQLPARHSCGFQRPKGRSSRNPVPLCSVACRHWMTSFAVVKHLQPSLGWRAKADHPQSEAPHTCCASLWPLHLQLLLARTMRACSWGPWAAVRWGRSGRAAGVAKDGNAFSRGQEPARKARPHLTHFPSMDGRKAPTGVPFLFGYFLFGHAKRK